MPPEADRTPESPRAALLRWYDAHRRDLPWRARESAVPDPYAVWVSEVMLQQTRVETVQPYFLRWMEAFPTLRALAGAHQDEVLKAWEGLGYYSRARNLHRAVREVVLRYGGRVPSDPATFRSLPGVGRYTAGAVGSIAFGLEEPVVDGNVRRVLARRLDRPDPSERELWDLASELVRGERPGDLNQALMELGAIVCTPRAPLCGSCPVRETCRAFAAGTVEERPARRKPRLLPVERVGVAVIEKAGRVLLVRRPERGRLAGLWEFPGARCMEGESGAAAARRRCDDLVEAAPADPAPLCAFSHTFTHVRVAYEAFHFGLSGVGEIPAASPDAVWTDRVGIQDRALPRAQQRIAQAFLGVRGNSPSRR